MSTATIRETFASGETTTQTPGLRPYRITIDVYQRIVASGVFGDKSSIFLWKGQLVEKIPAMTKGRPHVYAVNRLDQLPGRLVPEDWFVEQDQPLAMDDDSMPEPDLKVVRGAVADYQDRTPTAQDVPLVVEVSDSSLGDDKRRMLRAYASAVIPVYWIVNLPCRQIEVFTRPSGPTSAPSYADHHVYGPKDEVPVLLDGGEVGQVAAKDILI